MYPMMCTVHHVGSIWHKKWSAEERHSSHSSTERICGGSARRLWFKVVMFYITHSITLLEVSQLCTKEILRHTKRTTTTRSFQTTFLKSFPHQQPHDPKPQQQLHDPKQEPFCSVRVALLPSVRRHGRRCVQNCGFFSCLQRRACAIEQTHFGSTAQKQSCQASQGVECSQDFLVSQALDVAARAQRGIRRLGVYTLIASIHTQYIRMSRCDVSFQTCFCDIKKFSLAMVHSSWLSWLDRRRPSGQKV